MPARRRTMKTLALALALLTTLTSTACDSRGGTPAQRIRPRNLIWISLDTLRADRLGCYGYTRPTSPALDALAAESVRFENASSPAPWTKPAHASLFTGLWPRRHGVLAFENTLAPGVVHVADWMAQHGFQTLAVVSNSVLTLHDMPRGFASFDFLERGQGPEPSGVTARTIERLAALGRERPFFAFVHYNDMHARYRSLPHYEAEFTRPYAGSISSRAREFLEHLTGVKPFDARDVAHISDLYDAALRQLDDQLAELFRYLESAQLLQDTLVVVTSDHGEEFFDHGSVSHGMTQYQELVRVPLLFRAPGLAAGGVATAPVSLVDVLPTCLAVLGVPPPPGLDGRDVSGLLYEPGVPPAAAASEHLLHYEASCAVPTASTTVPEPGQRYAISDGRFKLHWDAESDTRLLFDLAADPAEKAEASAQHPEAAARLFEELRRYRTSTAAEPRDGGLLEEDLRRLQELGYVQGFEEK